MTSPPVDRRRLSGLALSAVLMLCSGCASMGAAYVAVDRDAYAERLRESEKAQLLTNIVGLRFGDAPLLLRVTSVINQYTREASGALSLRIVPTSNEDVGGVAGNVLVRETPTVTYTPLSGEAFAHTMLAPIPPASLLAMLEAGWAADDLLTLTARSINGVRAPSGAPLFEQPASADLAAIIQALRRLQRSGALSIGITQHDSHFTAHTRLSSNLTEADRADLAFLRDVLSAPISDSETEVVFSNAPPQAHQIAIATRNMLEILAELAQGVDVSGDETSNQGAIMRIHSGDARPTLAYAAIRYRQRWFWIEADDHVSIRRFLITQILLALTDESAGGHAPLVTIPIN